jgi:hypothetical protein
VDLQRHCPPLGRRCSKSHRCRVEHAITHMRGIRPDIDIVASRPRL